MVIAREALSFRAESLNTCRLGSSTELFAIYVAEDEKCRPRYRSHEDRFPFADEFRSRADCSEGMPSPQIHPSVFLIFQEAAHPKRSNAPYRPSFQN